MIRLLTGVLLSALAGAAAVSQSNQAAMPGEKTGAAALADPLMDKAEVARLIALNEAAVRDGEASHADLKRLVMLYSNLGVLYEEAGMYLKAEDVIDRAIVLLKNGPQDRLAKEVDQLAVLHLAMHKTREAEKDEMQNMQIQKAIADPVGIAIAEGALAALYDEEGKFAKALDYAEKAYDVLADRAEVPVLDRIGVRHTLGFALTGLRECDRGLQTMKDALELAKTSPGLNNMEVGYSEFMLGFGYWHCGDRDRASTWLGHGTADMKTDYGWEHAMYVDAMKNYARFLRESGQREAAVTAESVVNQANAQVDAGALTGRTDGFRSSGSR
jgi:tetratricopeptide (TPR) repeat protein